MNSRIIQTRKPEKPLCSRLSHDSIMTKDSTRLLHLLYPAMALASTCLIMDASEKPVNQVAVGNDVERSDLSRSEAPSQTYALDVRRTIGIFSAWGIVASEETVPAWRLSEIGLTAGSTHTSTGHRAIFMANYAPWMLRIGHLTEDAFLMDIARSAIIGRYRNFPGYHMNTARTTVYEAEDYPLKPHLSLGFNSFHYNHVWPMMSFLLDYLVKERFPWEFTVPIDMEKEFLSSVWKRNPKSAPGRMSIVWNDEGAISAC